MSDTLLSQVASTLKQSTVEDLADQMGESEQSVANGMELATAAVLGGLSHKAADSDTIRQVIELAVKTPSNAVAAAVGKGQLTGPQTTLISSGVRFLSSLFDGNQDVIADSISREAGVGSGSARTLMALGAQSVLGFIGTHVRDEGMTAGALAGWLQSEGKNLRKALPAGFNRVFTTPYAGARTSGHPISRTLETAPVAAQGVIKERSILPWLLPIAALLVGALWYAYRPTMPTIAEMPLPLPPPVATTGTSLATGAADAVAALGTMVPRTLPDGIALNIPERGVEGRLLAFIQDPNSTPDATTWFDFDRLLFDTGSATLQPQSQDQLGNIAAILKASPNVHLKIGVYADNVGSTAENTQLSQERAHNVMAELVRLGVAADRLAAEGYGEGRPIADNSTDADRALNGRVSMLVTQK